MSEPIAEPAYQRLTWSRRRPSGFVAFSPARSSLWLADDHVLCIDTTGYNENYKRFYFRDIQAVILRKTDRGQKLALGLGVLAGLFTLFAVVVSEPALAYVLGGIAAILVIALVLDLIAGPTCVCHLRTAVQTEELPSLSRLRRSRKILARLRPRIAAAQGELSPRELQDRLRQSQGSSANAGEANPGTEHGVADAAGVPPQKVS